jgi:hypothetical protein
MARSEPLRATSSVLEQTRERDAERLIVDVSARSLRLAACRTEFDEIVFAVHDVHSCEWLRLSAATQVYAGGRNIRIL